MLTIMKNIILASQSPRRKQLLEQAELSFTIRTAHSDEDFPPGMAPEEVPLFIARNKARAVADTLSPQERSAALIIAADTVVLLDGKIIGKPADEADAAAILGVLSGRMHRVVTGVTMWTSEGERSFSEVTEVYFGTLSPEQIRHYVSRYRPLDKAGAYAIQEWIGLAGIRKINGDFYNVMGLPVSRVLQELQEMTAGAVL